MTTKEILIAEAVYHKGDWNKIVEAIRTKELLSTKDIIRINSKLKCKTLTLIDADYPDYLKHLPQPPIVLFYEGDISLISNPSKCLGVVGTREPTIESMEMTRKIIKKTNKQYITVSGLASGIDRVAHKAAIEFGGKTVAVLGSGINYCFPSENQDIFKEIARNHLLISEYPPGCPPYQTNFPVRNRLIAMFSKGILITEGKLRSGTSITASFASDFGRAVMCVPSTNFGDSVCNRLIKEGAALVENADDVLLVME